MLIIFMNQEKELSNCLIIFAKNMTKNIYKSKQGTGLKILTLRQMLQRVPIVVPQIKADNNSESL